MKFLMLLSACTGGMIAFATDSALLGVLTACVAFLISFFAGFIAHEMEDAPQVDIIQLPKVKAWEDALKGVE